MDEKAGNFEGEPASSKDEAIVDVSRVEKVKVEYKIARDELEQQKEWFRKIVLEKQLSIIVHSDRAAVDVAIMIVKTLILLNGAALIAVVTFLEREGASTLSKANGSAAALSKTQPNGVYTINLTHISHVLWLFGGGLACSILMAIITFAYQSALTGRFQKSMKGMSGDIKWFDGIRKKTCREKFFTIFLAMLAILTLVLFGRGLYSVTSSF